MKGEIITQYDITENSMQEYWSKPDALKNKMQNFQTWKEVAELTPREIAYCIIYKTISTKELNKLNKHLSRYENTVKSETVDCYIDIWRYIHTTVAPRQRNAADEVKFLCERMKNVLLEKKRIDFFINEMQQIYDCNFVAFNNLDAVFRQMKNKCPEMPEINDLIREGEKINTLWINDAHKTITTDREQQLPYIFENGEYLENKDFFNGTISDIRKEFKEWMPVIKAYIIAFENWCVNANLLDFLEGSRIISYIDYVKRFYVIQWGEIVDALPFYCAGYYKTITISNKAYKNIDKENLIPDYYDIKPLKTDYLSFTQIFNSKLNFSI